jgi:hypothetical protein
VCLDILAPCPLRQERQNLHGILLLTGWNTCKIANPRYDSLAMYLNICALLREYIHHGCWLNFVEGIHFPRQVTCIKLKKEMNRCLHTTIWISGHKMCEERDSWLSNWGTVASKVILAHKYGLILFCIVIILIKSASKKNDLCARAIWKDKFISAGHLTCFCKTNYKRQM